MISSSWDLADLLPDAHRRVSLLCFLLAGKALSWSGENSRRDICVSAKTQSTKTFAT